MRDEDSLVEPENILERELEKKPENFLLEDSTERLLDSFEVDALTKEMIRLNTLTSDSFRNQAVQLHVAKRLKELIDENRIEEIDDINKIIRTIESEFYPFCESPYAEPIGLWQYFTHFVDKTRNPENAIRREDMLRKYFDPVYDLHDQFCQNGIGKFCRIPDPCPPDTPDIPHSPKPMEI